MRMDKLGSVFYALTSTNYLFSKKNYLFSSARDLFSKKFYVEEINFCLL